MRRTAFFAAVLLASRLRAEGLPADRATAAHLDAAGVLVTTSHARVRYEPGRLTTAQMQEFAHLFDRGVDAVARFTGVAAPRRVDVYVVGDDIISHTFPSWPGGDGAPRMFIAASRVAHHTAPYLHETVHAVVGDGDAMWLEEGYASWVASELAERNEGYYAPVLSQGNDRVDTQARAIVAGEAPGDLARELNWIRGSAEPRFAYDEERTNFYILAHSFTKFLASRIGVAQLTAIHRANDIEELARRTGKTSAAWRAEWLASLKSPATAPP